MAEWQKVRVFLSCVSSEFRSYRLKLANRLGELPGYPYEIKVQEDFQQGGHTLLEALADYVRNCDVVIHMVGDAMHTENYEWWILLGFRDPALPSCGTPYQTPTRGRK